MVNAFKNTINVAYNFSIFHRSIVDLNLQVSFQVLISTYSRNICEV